MHSKTIELERFEEEALEKMVSVGLFSNQDEAVRASIIKYASDLGVISSGNLWSDLNKQKKRSVTPEQLMADLEAIENET